MGQGRSNKVTNRKGAFSIALLIGAAFAGILGFYSGLMIRMMPIARTMMPAPHNGQSISKPTVPTIPNMSSTLRIFIDSTASRMLDPIVNMSSTGAAPSGRIAKICTGRQKNLFGCYADYYRGLVANQGIPAAFADIKARYAANGYVRGQCHPLTHIIGQAAVVKYPDIADAYVHGDSFCWSGYYHGVLEGVAFKMGKEKMFARLNALCADIPGAASYSFDYYNCVHGIGHGIMEITNDELFDSLADCDALTGLWERTSCYSGVFMENIILTTDKDGDRTTKYLKPDEPLYPCTAVGEAYKGACYLMQTSYALTAVGGDFSRVFALCKGVEIPYRDTCYQSLGRDASGRSVSDASSTKATCLLGTDDEQIANCVIGAVKDFVSYFHSDGQADVFCASLDSKFASLCSSTAKNYYQNFK